MLGWRKRNDGFEWREYVRTTILVRRKQRRDRLGEAGRAAVENIKDAGHRGAAAGAEGVKAVGRGALNLGQQGAAMGAIGAKAMGHGAVRYGQEGARLGLAGAQAGAARLRDAVPVAGSYLQRFGAAVLYALAYAFAVVRTLAGIATDHLGPLVRPLGNVLRRPPVRLPLLIAGAVALLAGIIRAYVNGFVRDTWIVLIVGLVLLGALALAHAASGIPGIPERLSAPVLARSRRARDALAAATGLRSVQIGMAVAVLGLALAGGIYAWEASSEPLTTAALAQRTRPVAPVATGTVTGRAAALSGEALRLGAMRLRLDGIEAPLPDQRCAGTGGKDWACGEAARQALTRLLRTGSVTCDVTGSAADQSTATCRIGERDVAAELVRGGDVFAAGGLFAAYTAEEREARNAKAGIWSGEALRPADYRDRKWEEARQASPDGCPIKGDVRGGRRVYLVPWASGYERARVTRSRGERWFCSEAEAQQAGFRRADQS